MAKIIKKGSQSVVIEFGNTELHVYVQKVLEAIDNQEIETQNDQILVLMALSGIEPLVPLALPETQVYYNEILEDVKEIVWEDDNEAPEVQNEEISQVEENEPIQGEESDEDEGESDENEFAHS